MRMPLKTVIRLILKLNPLKLSQQLNLSVRKLFRKDETLNSLRLEIHQLTKEKYDQGNTIRNQNREIKDLEISFKNAKQASDKLNKEICRNRSKFEEEKATIAKLHKAEIKSWKRDFGEERKEKLKLEAKLKETTEQNRKASSNLSNIQIGGQLSQDQGHVCSVCADNIEDYIPDYFMGDEVNAAFEKCKEASAACDDDNADSSSEDQTSKEPYNLWGV